MKMQTTGRKGRNPRRGSALLASMIVVLILTFAAAGVLSYSLTTYRNSVRQALLDQAKELADSEMENLFYAWKNALLNKVPVANVCSVSLATLQASTTPFSAAFQPPAVPTGTYSVTRNIAFNALGSGDGSAQGIVPGTVQIGRNYYFTAETGATVTKPLVGAITFHSGRHFVFSSTSLFQFAVFYQGNLEMAAGGNMVVGGAVSTNASAYLGSQTGYSLQLSDNVYYFQNYNGASDPLTGETDRLFGGSTLVDPIYNPNPLAAAPANQAAQRALQVSKLATQSNFVGGVDVAADIANASYAAAYTNLLGQVDPNEIYRAVIAPPPLTGGVPDTEDPVVKASRMYNNAGLLITVSETTAGVQSVHVGGYDVSSQTVNPTLYDTVPAFATIVAPGNTGTEIIQNVRTKIFDPRERANGTAGVNLTTVDIGNLTTALALARTQSTALAANYNGVLYVYDKSDNSASGRANTLNGIRLTHAVTTPNFNDQNGNPLGFTVVSDNGVYVQGDYNTTPITVGGASVTNPSALMGDAITALSEGWSLAASTGALPPISSRRATASTGSSPPGMSIDAAILTGNTPANSTTPSGGVQNLVRMIEDWYYPDPLGNGSGLTLTLSGSLGQLFTSKYFTGSYAGTSALASLGGDKVYLQPKTRNINYDLNFKSRTPAGSPTTTNFARGDFFFW